MSNIYIEWDVGYLDNRRIAKLRRHGKDVRGLRDLYLHMALYCKRALSDGYVPDEEIPLMVHPDTAAHGRRDAQRLADVGLIERAPDDEGWIVPGFLQRNKTRSQVLTDSASKADQSSQKGSFGNHKRWHVARGEQSPDCPYCIANSDPEPSPTDRQQRSGSDRQTSLRDRDRDTTAIQVVNHPSALTAPGPSDDQPISVVGS